MAPADPLAFADEVSVLTPSSSISSSSSSVQRAARLMSQTASNNCWNARQRVIAGRISAGATTRDCPLRMS
eukprot:8869334-Lingulodinium_polyedra.AAC.1